MRALANACLLWSVGTLEHNSDVGHCGTLSKSGFKQRQNDGVVDMESTTRVKHDPSENASKEEKEEDVSDKEDMKEDEEDEECGFCKFMKAGPCGDVFEVRRTIIPQRHSFS